LNNNTAGVREREDGNRTKEAGNRDEVEGVVANTLDAFRGGAVGFIDWLDVCVLASRSVNVCLKLIDNGSQSSHKRIDAFADHREVFLLG
jgi:hypothetical protein